MIIPPFKKILSYSVYKQNSFLCFSLMILHICLSLIYSKLLPWGGDEWYTYHDQSITGVPNNWLVSLLKYLLGPVNLDNYLIYRQVGLFWTVFIFPITVFVLNQIIKSYEKAFIIFFLILFTLSPFIWFQEQMFRYYGLYLLFSFIVNVSIYFLNASFFRYKWLFYTLLIVSLPIHFLITWQLFIYIFWKEFSNLSFKYRIYTFSFTLILILVLLYNLRSIWDLILFYGVIGVEFRGLGLQSFAKPIISVFQYIVGYEMMVTENITIIIFFVYLLVLLFSGILLSLTNKFKKYDFLFASIIPFLGAFFIVEPLTMPGATNLESKHVMFFFFWMVYYIHLFINVISKGRFKLLLFLPIFILLISANYFSFNAEKDEWSRVVKLIKDSDIVFVDGPSKLTLEFYASNLNPQLKVQSIWDTTTVKLSMNQFNRVALVLSDYKQYAILTKEQMWNSGTNSYIRFENLDNVFKNLNTEKFKLLNSYTNYPLLVYTFEKQLFQHHSQVFMAIHMRI